MGIAEANVRPPEWKQRHAGRASEALAQLDQKEGGHPVEFARLAHTFEELEQTSSRLTLIELLTQLFRSIEQPEEIEQVCYLVQGRVAPFFVALEMGMAEKSVMKSLAMASHTTPEQNDPERDQFVTVTKIGTGLSDEQWRSIRERTKGLEVD